MKYVEKLLLSHRRQYVCYKGLYSEVQEVDYGVSQGSVLGLLFIYIQTIDHTPQSCLLITQQFLCNQYLNDVSKGLSDSYKVNQLSANKKIKKSIHFGCGNIVVHAYLRLSMDGKLLKRVSSTKFVGLFIDEQLAWEFHIKHC